jgi:DNA-binding transcriptional regulator YdaS (Cro superfamily)
MLHHLLTFHPHVGILVRTMEAIKRAAHIIGSQSGIASAVGVAPQVVHNWIKRGNVPAEYCPRIERATHGAVRCEDLRPDVDWAYLRATDCPVEPIHQEEAA